MKSGGPMVGGARAWRGRMATLGTRGVSKTGSEIRATIAAGGMWISIPTGFTVGARMDAETRSQQSRERSWALQPASPRSRPVSQQHVATTRFIIRQKN